MRSIHCAISLREKEYRGESAFGIPLVSEFCQSVRAYAQQEDD